MEFRGNSKIVYRRYAGLFFCACVDVNDNGLAYLEAIHLFVEVLDQFFGNVCELDLVFHFDEVSLVRSGRKSISCTITSEGTPYPCRGYSRRPGS